MRIFSLDYRRLPGETRRDSDLSAVEAAIRGGATTRVLLAQRLPRMAPEARSRALARLVERGVIEADGVRLSVVGGGQ